VRGSSAESANKGSTRCVDLVGESLVIGMLAPLTISDELLARTIHEEP
jgi:hypothetical protein